MTAVSFVYFPVGEGREEKGIVKKKVYISRSNNKIDYFNI